jgi:hypothetical protein
MCLNVCASRVGTEGRRRSDLPWLYGHFVHEIQELKVKDVLKDEVTTL